jgi:hypothetical protein
MLMILVYVGYVLAATPFGSIPMKVCIYKAPENVYTPYIIYHLPWQICAKFRNV